MKLIITTFFLLNAVSSFHVPPSYTNNKKQQHKQLNAVPLEIDPGITIPIIALGGLVLAFAKNNSTEMSSIITAKSSSKTTTTTKKQEKVATKKQMKKIEKGSNERPEKSLKYWEDVFRVEEEVMGLPVEKEVFESLTTMKPATTVIVVDETVGAIASEESSRSKTSLFAKSNNTYDDDIENVDDMGRIQYSATEENEEVKSQQQKSIEEEETVTANDTNADAETAEEKEEETTTPIAATDTISSKETETKNDEKTSLDSYKFQRALLEAQLQVEKKRIETKNDDFGDLTDSLTREKPTVEEEVFESLTMIKPEEEKEVLLTKEDIDELRNNAATEAIANNDDDNVVEEEEDTSKEEKPQEEDKKAVETDESERPDDDNVVEEEDTLKGEEIPQEEDKKAVETDESERPAPTIIKLSNGGLNLERSTVTTRTTDDWEEDDDQKYDSKEDDSQIQKYIEEHDDDEEIQKYIKEDDEIKTFIYEGESTTEVTNKSKKLPILSSLWKRKKRVAVLSVALYLLRVLLIRK
eukprot:CAMPEP_0194194910 /NCGR_PEP_ID=MMETSP0154-20130528/75836_1 /TAXON_ID=1049557 /ORGANISM="Thalassiothrix antarctica, Strain L6-D1" /LENGTH=525 /DNA_ID=CAMNT_0038919379 /DNA_START=103 /DNA_END=1680 /DNA_ORIENTATION=+